MLFCVVSARRGEDAALAAALERGERDVEVERAVDGAEREAERGGRAGNAEADDGAVFSFARRGRLASPAARARPPTVPCSGTPAAWCCRCPASTRPLRPHWMPTARAKSRLVWTIRASTSTCGSARSMVDEQGVDRVELGRQVGDDQRVGAVVDLHVAARRQRRALDAAAPRRGPGVAEGEGAHRERPGVSAADLASACRESCSLRSVSSARCGRWCRRRCSRAGCRAG